MITARTPAVVITAVVAVQSSPAKQLSGRDPTRIVQAHLEAAVSRMEAAMSRAASASLSDEQTTQHQEAVTEALKIAVRQEGSVLRNASLSPDPFVSALIEGYYQHDEQLAEQVIDLVTVCVLSVSGCTGTGSSSG